MTELIPLIVASKTRYELELEKRGNEERASLEELFARDPDFERIVAKHKLHKKNIETIAEVVGKEHIIDRALLAEKLKEYDLIVTLGGDNHFSYCAQVVLAYLKDHPDEKKYLVGVLSDRKRSRGAMLNYNIESFLTDLPSIFKGEFVVEAWTALETRVYKEDENGIEVEQSSPPPAICDIFIGEEKRILMSRSKVYKLKEGETLAEDAKEELHEKSSGIIIATGSGSEEGSWYFNVHKSLFGEGETFGHQEAIAKAIVTEAYDFQLEEQEYIEKCKVTITSDEYLLIKSFNDDKGIISPSSHIDQQVAFGMGVIAEIRISDLELLVVKPKK